MSKIKARIFDKSIKLADNAMLKRRPELFYEWDFEKNDELGLDVYKVTYGSGRKAWWKCETGHEWDAQVSHRATRYQGCPYCSGQRVSHSNSLLSLFPDVTKTWHPTKNNDLKPKDVSYGSDLVYWWLGECGHEWKASPNNRTGGRTGCPYCAHSPTVLKGFNDMWTTNPELAEMLLNSKDGSRHTKNSSKKADWKCGECKTVIFNRKISEVARKGGISCPRCSDGVSYPEKFMYNVLRSQDIQFEYQKVFDWLKDRSYDFYLTEYNWIIEVHGAQHSKKSFETISPSARTLAEEIENDKLKHRKALKNGIDNYITVNAKNTYVENISKEIMLTDIKKLISAIDFSEIGRMSTKSLVKEVCDYWNTGEHSNTEIAQKLGLSRGTVIEYLKRGGEVGWCNYCPALEMQKSGPQNSKKRRVEVIQLTEDERLLNEFDSVTSCSIFVKSSNTSISNWCTGKHAPRNGYKWMYRKDHKQMLEEGLSHQEYMSKYYPKK